LRSLPASSRSATSPVGAAKPTPGLASRLSLFGDLKYPAGFKHFDYVNPKAPKGGVVASAVRHVRQFQHRGLRRERHDRGRLN
jgi:ABC-type oligopeptide transport system substrate-binding subunit